MAIIQRIQHPYDSTPTRCKVYGLGTIVYDGGSRRLAEQAANPWARRSEHLLFRNERAKRLWNLRSELLRGNPTHDRAEEIVKEIAALRQQQAHTWVE